MMRRNKTVQTALSGVLLLTVVAAGVTVYKNKTDWSGQQEQTREEAQQVQEEEMTDVSTGNAQAEHIQESEDSVHPLMDEFEIQAGIKNPYISEKESIEVLPEETVEGQGEESKETEKETKESETTAQEDKIEETTEDKEVKKDSSQQEKTAEEVSGEEVKDVSGAAQDTMNFSEDSNIVWPASGQVIIDYNMDRTVYFPTLDQYKYHEGLVVSTKVGEPVQAVFHGKVSGIHEDARTGVTLTMDLGNGYEAVYGQLKDIVVKEGETIEKGTILGHVQEPTKYYVKEGANLYFAMKKDGKYVDPMLYLEDQPE